MEEMIEAFFGILDGDNDGNEESENDPIIECLQLLTSMLVWEGSRALVLCTFLTLLNL